MSSSSGQKYLKDISTAGIVIVSIYIAAQMLSDIASLKIAYIAGFSVDAGTFIYPIFGSTELPADINGHEYSSATASAFPWTVLFFAGVHLVLFCPLLWYGLFFLPTSL
jgi:hypothetical protein